MEWSCPTWPTPALCKHLPEEILNHPLDTKDMMHRVKIFAATVALHQAFVDLVPEVPESDSKRFRSMLDHANHTFEIPRETMTSLRELRHLCDATLFDPGKHRRGGILDRCWFAFHPTAGGFFGGVTSKVQTTS